MTGVRAAGPCPVHGPGGAGLPPTRAGFSLLEILAVLGILSVLSAIAVPRYLSLRDRTQVSVMKADLYQLRLMQERHRREGERPYAADVAALQEVFRPSPGIEVTIVDAGPDGYTAIATHSGTNQRCTYTSEDGRAECSKGLTGPDTDPTTAPGSGGAVGTPN